MANIILKEDILNILDEGCFHIISSNSSNNRGIVCGDCVADIRTFVIKLLQRIGEL